MVRLALFTRSVLALVVVGCGDSSMAGMELGMVGMITAYEMITVQVHVIVAKWAGE